jgi:APA family basic amino acid/polyamine antiporter
MPGSAPEPIADRPGLVRAISRFDLTAAIVNGVIGSAIFGMPAALAALTGAFSPLAALLGGLGILAIVLSFAEVASRFRDPGGPYLYAREAFSPLVGFEVGWLTFWTRVLSAAANLNVFVLYFGELVPAARHGAGRAAVMLTVLALMTLVNVVGVRQATWAVDLFTLGKLLPLVLLILLGVGHVSGEVLASQGVGASNWTQAILLLVFAYGGFEAALIPASEARDPRRDTGFALLAGLGAVAAVYLLVQLVVVGVLPRAAEAKAPIAAAFGVLLGPTGVLVASLAAMVSVTGWATGNVLQAPRLLYSMAERGELPAVLGRVHARFRTPAPAIVTFALVSLAFGLTGDFAQNATFAAIVRLTYYGLTCAALVVLRRRSASPPGFHVPGGPLVAAVGLLFCLWLLSTRTFEQGWILVALVVAGLPLYWRARPAPAGSSA